MVAAGKKDIRRLTKEALTEALEALGEKPFRAKQIHEWLWQKGVHSFEEMTNLPKLLRRKLADQFSISAIKEDLIQHSRDGTIKIRFRLHDDQKIEGVLIPDKQRVTACVSSQVGCSLTCKFCATGMMGHIRNLEAAEIFDQVILLNKQSIARLGRPITNIVFMGMGEPLLNYRNVMLAIEKITSPEGLSMAPKRITLSTAGIAKMIRRLADDGARFNLALSLHAANDTKRNMIMPINETNRLDALVEALSYFKQKTHSEITFEYILFEGFNDTLQDALEVVALCKRVPAKVNIIEYNKVAGVGFKKTEVTTRDTFQKYLTRHGIIARIRRSRGKDIDAACGQLANK